LTFYCHVHVDWEGLDLGKIHDHIAKDHQEDLASATTINEYFRLVKNLFASKIYEVTGPSRLSDQQWLNRYHGRPPKIGNLMGNNEVEK